jgi:hypothetical protein
MPDMAEPQDAAQSDLLGLLGQVAPPAASVLQAAREALWSAVADETLTGAGREIGDRGRSAPRQPGEPRRVSGPDQAQPDT